jgi:fibronectin type 3 domain-containing protein
MQDGHEDRRVDDPGLPSETRHHLGSWLRALAGLCLAAAVAGGAVAGGAVILAGGSTAGADAHIADPSLSAPCPSDPKPVPPYCLNAEPDNTKVHLTWDPAAPVKNKPAIYYGTSKEIRQNIGHVDVTSTDPTVSDATVSDLTNGTTYYFWLIEDQFPNVVSNMASATPVTKPGAPTGLTPKPGNSQVTLSWTAPVSDGGSEVSSYNVFEGTTADLSGSAPVTNVTGTTVTLPSLINGTTYFFAVAAVNAAGQGPLSIEMQAVPMTVPEAPTGLTATRGNTQVVLSWAAPASEGGSQVTGYDLYVGTTADLSRNAPVARVTDTVVTVTNLMNGTRYYFWVTAVNQVGAGPPSNEVSAVPLTVPGAPTGLTATPGGSQVTLSWAEPTSGGAAIDGYLIFEGTRPGGENPNPVNGSLVTDTSYTVPGLTNGTTYYFRVTAVNAAGQGPLSAEAPATLLRIIPTSPPPSTPTSDTPTSDTPTSDTPTSGTTTPFVTPQTSAGTTAQKVSAPTGLTATPGDARVHLSWTPPASYGAPVISYKVYLASLPGVQESAAIGTSKSPDATVAGLANGTVYYFMVAAINAAGTESPLSAQVTAEPTGATSVVPLPSPGPPKWLITVLAAAAAIVVGGALTLLRRRFGKPRPDHPARAREEIALAQDVRAVPDTARPDRVSVHDTGPEPTHTVRLEPHPGTITTTIKEGRP